MTAASDGLVSNECGSVFGLLSMALTRTYRPPIWAITLAYWFSAPTAMTTPVLAVAVSAAPLEEHAASRQPAAVSTAAMAVRRAGMGRLLDWGLSWAGPARSGSLATRALALLLMK